MDILVTVLLAIFATVLLVVEVVFIPGFGFTGFAGLVAMALIPAPGKVILLVEANS